ncbi:MAG: BrnA antitoxin family protein [Clostridiales bacterium]|nr:BrnA antitoxin family protein [Clostridiales bacterium]
MLDNYDIENLNPRKNPYAKELKKQITINVSTAVVDYFKEMSQEVGIPYQTLINLYLTDCVKKQVKLDLEWNKKVG